MKESLFYVTAAYGAAAFMFLGLLWASLWELRRQQRFLGIKPLGVRFFWVGFLFFVFLGALVFMAKTPSAVNDRVPVFSLDAVEGLHVPGVKTQDFAHAKVSVVNFWASWCPPCRAEHPLLMRLREENVQMIGIVYKDTDENARRFLGAYGNPFDRVGADRRGMIGLSWGLFGVPETYVVEASGKILVRHLGPLNEDVLQHKILPTVRRAITLSERRGGG